MGKFFWTTARIDELRRLWAEGAPIPRIAAALGTTKGAVCGKAHRLGLPMRKPTRNSASKRDRVLQQGKTFRGRVSQPRSRAPVQLAGPAWSHPKKA